MSPCSPAVIPLPAQHSSRACHQALRLDQSVRDHIPYYMVMLDKVRRMASQFDVLHFHIDQFHFPLFSKSAARTVTTLHGRQDLPDLKLLYRDFPGYAVGLDLRRPALTDSRRQFCRHRSSWASHDLLAPTLHARGGYLAFLGRISPEKRVDRAIEIARAVGLPLKIAAKVDRVDEAYFESEIRPLLSLPGIEYIGEIDERSEERISRRRPGVALPHRLAGALRPCHDRGDGLRHSRSRVPAWLGARGDRRGRHRLRGRQRRRSAA